MATRGRKRKSGDRYQSGDIKRESKDMATIQRKELRAQIMTGPEPRRHRNETEAQFDARKQRWIEARDANLSPDFPLSILFARGIIDRDMHAAGMRFGEVYVRVFGAPNASGPAWAKMYRTPPGDEMPSSPMPYREDGEDGRHKRAEAEYAHSLRQLDGLPERILSRQLVHQLAAYLHFDWYVKDVMAHQATADRHRRRTNTICRALTALANMDPVSMSSIIGNPIAAAGRFEPAPAGYSQVA